MRKSGPISQMAKMAQVKTRYMHGKLQPCDLAYSTCLGWTIVSIAWYHPMTSYFLQL